MYRQYLHHLEPHKLHERLAAMPADQLADLVLLSLDETWWDTVSRHLEKTMLATRDRGAALGAALREAGRKAPRGRPEELLGLLKLAEVVLAPATVTKIGPAVLDVLGNELARDRYLDSRAGSELSELAHRVCETYLALEADPDLAPGTLGGPRGARRWMAPATSRMLLALAEAYGASAVAEGDCDLAVGFLPELLGSVEAAIAAASTVGKEAGPGRR